MPSPSDLANTIKFNVDDATYLALKHRCDSVDRNMSQHIRHLVKEDIKAAVKSDKGGGWSVDGRDGEL